MIRLFTTLFPETNANRRAEYAECLRRNLACAEIDEVCLLAEGEGLSLPDSPKLRVQRIGKRPLYADYFAWTEKLVGPRDISMIANADIFFDSQLGLFKVWELPERTALALARWDVAPDGTTTLCDRNDSQDTWIFRGPLRGVRGDFAIGVPCCDNRILFELQEAGFRVANPSFSVRSYHLHAGPRVEYADTLLPHYVTPPYRYLWPHNLWPLPRTLWHNFLNPGCRLYYRWDQRKFNRWLPVRVVRRLFGIVGLTKTNRKVT